MVIVPDRLSDLVRKGEVTDRYYNPGDLFRRVHLVLVNDDHPRVDDVRRMAGSAEVEVHNLPSGRRLLLGTAGWTPALLRRWGRKAVDLARSARPQLVRCHGAWLNAIAASCIKSKLGVPYVVSLHTNPDEDVRKHASSALEHLRGRLSERVERASLRSADLALPVYEDIVPYLERLGVRPYEVAYNVLNPSHLRAKTTYELRDPVRVVSVGRLFAEKNPANLISAVRELPRVHVTIIGDGPYLDRLRRLAEDEGITDRVLFRPSVPNDQLCRELPRYDIFAVHTEYWGISKSVLEALLSGLPVVINRRRGQAVTELTPDICRLVTNSVGGYRGALAALIEDDAAREALGRTAASQAAARWSPAASESRIVEIYRRLLGRVAA